MTAAEGADSRGSAGMREAGERNVLGGPLDICGSQPRTGFYRDGYCRPPGMGAARGGHTVAAVMTRDFLEHQQSLGNDLVSPKLELGFPGLTPGDRWCVLAVRWMQSFLAGSPAPVVLSATHECALDIVPMSALRECAVDVPDDLSSWEPLMNPDDE